MTNLSEDLYNSHLCADIIKQYAKDEYGGDHREYTIICGKLMFTCSGRNVNTSM
jgi:hypothetical protein